MKQKLIILISIFLVPVVSISFLAIKTMKFDKYLDITPKDLNKLFINKYGLVQYENKIILKNNFIPLTLKTARTTLEIKTAIIAEKIQPKKECNPLDTVANGTLGCYLDNSFEE